MDKKKTGTFVNLNGEEFTVSGFTRMMAVRVEDAVKTNWELIDGRPLPKRPTYSVDGEDVFGGEKVVYYHTEDTLETEEEKKAWVAYQVAQDDLNTRIWRQMVYEAMNCVEVPMERLKEYAQQYKDNTGMSLPNPEQYTARVKRIFVEHVVLCDDTDEMMRLLTETMKIAGVISDTEAGLALESFRNQETEQGSESPERPDTPEPDSNS